MKYKPKTPRPPIKLNQDQRFLKCIRCNYFRIREIKCTYPGPGACVLIDKEIRLDK